MHKETRSKLQMKWGLYCSFGLAKLTSCRDFWLFCLLLLRLEFKNHFVTTSIWVSQRLGQNSLTKDQVFGIQILGKGVIIGDRVLLPNLAQREKWRSTSKTGDWAGIERIFWQQRLDKKMRFPKIIFFPR